MREADLKGEYGRAWRVDLDTIRERQKAGPDGSVGLWVIEAEFAHPLWQNYVLAAVHLRPYQDSVEPPVIYFDGATHEMWLYALDPNGDLNAMIEDMDSDKCRFLTPMNFAAQFIEITDALAVERCEKAIQLICDGKLSPDTDFINDWIKLFGDNMLRKV